jgi:hypothetical protein
MPSERELWRQVAEMHEAVELAPWLGDPQAEAEIEAAETILRGQR